MAVAAVSRQAFVVLRLEITRALSVGSLSTPRKYQNETTWCRRTISHRELCTTSSSFAPTLSPFLSKDFGGYKESKNHKDSKSHKDSKNSKSSKDNDAPDSTTVPDANGEQRKKLKHVIVEYHRGLPRITVPLPSRTERCVFILKPITSTIADFIDMLKLEDRGIDRAIVTTMDGTRIGCGNSIVSLLEEDFKLVINDVTYDVSPPSQEAYSAEYTNQLSDVRATVGQLYETLNCQEYNAMLEREVIAQLEEVTLELEPLELKRQELETAAARRANLLHWFGLVGMSIQVGILARLTWWEYSWDIMEPVTYFVTYGSAMFWYTYFILTNQEFMLTAMLNRRYLAVFHKKAKKVGLDVQHYNALKEKAYELETTLKIIRGPLWKQKNLMEQKRRERMRSSSSSSSSRSPSSSPSPSPPPSPKRNVPT